MSFQSDSLEEALVTLGELLTERGQSADIVVIGGGSLLLLGLLNRPTNDLDVVALVRSGAYQSADPLPEFLRVAIRDVALALGLADEWLNPGPTSLLDFGLPEGFEARVVVRRYANLVVRAADRFDQICFKLYATADLGPHSKHARDLALLNPSPDELLRAASWCTTHDPSEGFAQVLDQALRALRDNGDS